MIPPGRLVRDPRAKGPTLETLAWMAIADLVRPRTRAECEGVPRPCPFVSCRYNLYLDVREGGALVLNFPDLEVDEMPHSGCALDEAEAGGVELEHVGDLVNISREAARQNIAKALTRFAYRRHGVTEVAGYTWRFEDTKKRAAGRAGAAARWGRAGAEKQRRARGAS